MDTTRIAHLIGPTAEQITNLSPDELASVMVGHHCKLISGLALEMNADRRTSGLVVPMVRAHRRLLVPDHTHTARCRAVAE